MQKTLRPVLIIALGFVLYLIGSAYFKDLKSALDAYTHNGLLSYILTYFILGIPLFLATAYLNRSWAIWKHLGIGRGFLRGLVIAFLFCLPMFIGGALFFDLATPFNVPNLIAGTLIAGLVEELYYRGYLFGQLYKKTLLGFMPAIFFGAILFGGAHLYQSQDMGASIGIFAMTFMGAILFAWLYVEWEFNLWVPIFLHTFMNLAWTIFDMDSTALGGVVPNICRALTIAAAIVGTILYKKRHQLKPSINRENLIWRKE